MTDLSVTSHLQRRAVKDISSFEPFAEDHDLLLFLIKLDAPLRFDTFVGKAKFSPDHAKLASILCSFNISSNVLFIAKHPM